MTQTTLFAETVRLLLEGHIICAIANESSYDYLEQDHHFQAVDEFLQKIERKLARTTDHKAFFTVYLIPNEDSADKAIRNQFKEVVLHLESLVKFLSLCRVSQPGAEPLSAGSVLYESELLSAIEQSSAAQQLLDDLAKGRFVHSNATDGKGKLKTLMQRLIEHGYLVSVGRSGAHYIATAKWSWLYDTMSFIQAHEGYQEEQVQLETDSAQQEML